MKNYKPSIGGAGEVGQTEPITIDIDFRQARPVASERADDQ